MKITSIGDMSRYLAQRDQDITFFKQEEGFIWGERRIVFELEKPDDNSYFKKQIRFDCGDCCRGI